MNEFFELARAHAWIPLVALIVGALVRLLKSDVPFAPTIDAKWRPLAAVLLAQVAAVLAAIQGGMPALEAISGGAIAAVTAIGGHVVIIEWLRGGRELGEPKPIEVHVAPPGAL